MYHPPEPTAEESAAGYQSGSDFEFIRLTNVAATPLDLRELSFTEGIQFSFSASSMESLLPGGSVLLVKNRDAIVKRYGAGIQSMIAGEFVGSLDNGGEYLQLDWGNGNLPLQAFVYLDELPWPAAADGSGPSLLLVRPELAPDHSEAVNWTISGQPGGIPSGAARPLSFAQWQSLSFESATLQDPLITGPLADPDADGLTNLDEYAMGTVAIFSDAAASPTAGLEAVSGDFYQTYTYQLQNLTLSATVTPQLSSDLATWQSGAAVLTPVGTGTDNKDGTTTYTVRDVQPYSSQQRRYLRLSVTMP
jgi:hypothetical protein